MEINGVNLALSLDKKLDTFQIFSGMKLAHSAFILSVFVAQFDTFDDLNS